MHTCAWHAHTHPYTQALFRLQKLSLRGGTMPHNWCRSLSSTRCSRTFCTLRWPVKSQLVQITTHSGVAGARTLIKNQFFKNASHRITPVSFLLVFAHMCQNILSKSSNVQASCIFPGLLRTACMKVTRCLALQRFFRYCPEATVVDKHWLADIFDALLIASNFCLLLWTHLLHGTEASRRCRRVGRALSSSGHARE